MKRWLLLLLCAASGASHADSESWKGAYLGLNAGGIRANASWVTDATTGPPASEGVTHSMSGGFVGGQVGYRFPASDRLLLGLELTYQGADIKTRATSDVAVSRERETRVRNPLALTAQLGWAGSNALVFVRGGYARADVRLEAINNLVANVAIWEHHATGWTAGGGIEVLVRRRLSLGVAYDHAKLRAVDLTTVNNGGVTVTAQEFQTTLRTLALRANYRF